MDIETSGAIKLFFPNPSLTLVYFEALANALLGSVEPTAAPIANVAPYRGSLILENTSVAREFMPSQLIG